MSDHECRQGESANRGCCGKCSNPKREVPQESIASDGLAMVSLLQSDDLAKQSLVAEFESGSPD
jgi:hypothetical protein